MSNLSNADKLTKAKSMLVMYQPFFAQLICSLPMIEDAALNPPTMATNGKWIKFHPEFVTKCTVQEVMFVLCHEVGHCMFMHMYRRGNRSPKGFNIAGDFIINGMLVEEKIGVMPEGALYDQSPVFKNTPYFDIVKRGGGSTDGVYNLLPQSEDGEGGGEPGDGGPDQFDSCEDSGGSEAEQSLAEAEMKIAVQQAASAAKNCGKLGASLERFITQALQAKVDWRDVLRRFVSSKAKVERSYARPKRRFLADGLYLPSLGGEQMGEMVIAVDCSGSIGEEMNIFAAEMAAIKEDVLPAKMHVVYFHHAVSKYEVFGQDEDLVVAPDGTGGTAFSPIFNYIEAEGIEPECCVVLTDLCCNDFGAEPGYPTLWVSTEDGKAPWGEVVIMSKET